MLQEDMQKNTVQ